MRAHSLAVIVLSTMSVVACGGDDDAGACHPDTFDDSCDVIDCHDVELCDVECPGGTTCPDVDCSGADQCLLECSGGTACDVVDCSDALLCDVTCSGGALCNVDCEGAAECVATCSGGGPCLLLCAAADECDFADCSGGSGVVECDDGILACNRDCPSCGDGVCDLLLEDPATCSEDC